MIRGTSTRSLALDIGDRRIGVALSDTLGIIATPFKIITRLDEEQDIAAILDVVEENQVGVIVAGLPLGIDGEMTNQAEKVKAFTDKIVRKSKIPIEFRDESSTTSEARRIMLSSRSRKNRRASHDDDVAAAVLLQAYLEEKRATHG